ncbi:MAG: tRNA (N6-threonylcarbamoyladenosine(37)-N6)-methyltransferase TrmO [Halorhabdus sp.]
MENEEYCYEPIGHIHSPYDDVEGMPIQPSGADAVGTVEVDPAFADGLDDLEEFSHCILIYHFHQAADGSSMHVRPFLDDRQRGLFSTRAPSRPNPIGLSVVAIEGRDGATLSVRGSDVVDGTPLLDLKPYVPDFDSRSAARAGWIDAVTETARDVDADDRFHR